LFASLSKYGPTVSHPVATRFSFGPFFLFPDKRLLVCHGKQVKLGGRALDILIALVRQAGSVLSTRDLLAEVWRDTVVEEGSLRFHLVTLRKALSDGDPGVSYVVNVPGRGYTFVATVVVSGGAPAGSGSADVPVGARLHGGFLQCGGDAIVGREREIEQIIRQLGERRFVSIVGAGGIGKTTVANAVVERLREEFDGRVVCIDLSVIRDSDLVSATLVAALRQGQGTASIGEVCAAIGHTRTLVLLDCCEHLIDDVAQVVEVLYRSAAGISILVTSREVVNVDGEYVFRLPPLEVPPPGEMLSGRAALNYSAVRLFAERVVQAGCRFELTDENAQSVARLCRGLDGIALAIELAARQLPTFGLAGILELVDNNSRLMWHGRRTAVPRHQTLRATLDWSYGLLTERERLCLRRLAVFVGGFALEAAVCVVAAEDIERADVMEAINQLSNKSLLDVRLHDTGTRYFLLDTTRSYVRVKLEEAGELDRFCARHTSFYAARWLDESVADDACDKQSADFGNVRAALEWTLVREKDVLTGCRLVASYARLLLRRSMVGEVRKWTEIALAKLDVRERGSPIELELVASYGQALMFTGSNSREVQIAHERGLSIAMSLGDAAWHERLLCGLIMHLYRISDFRGALSFATEAVQWMLAQGRDASAVYSMQGVALHMMGDIASSSRLWDAVVESNAAHEGYALVPCGLGINLYLRALSGKARNLWLTGHSKDAEHAANDAIERARGLRHPATQCVTLIWAGEVFAWTGNWTRLTRIADELDTLVRVNGFTPYRYAAQGIRGQIAFAEGRAGEAIALLEACLGGMKTCDYTMPASIFRNALAMALCSNGDARRATLICDETIVEIVANGDALHLPQVLITKAAALRLEGDHRASVSCLRDALRAARKQGATAYERQIQLIGVDEV